MDVSHTMRIHTAYCHEQMRCPWKAKVIGELGPDINDNKRAEKNQLVGVGAKHTLRLRECIAYAPVALSATHNVNRVDESKFTTNIITRNKNSKRRRTDEKSLEVTPTINKISGPSRPQKRRRRRDLNPAPRSGVPSATWKHVNITDVGNSLDSRKQLPKMKEKIRVSLKVSSKEVLMLQKMAHYIVYY